MSQANKDLIRAHISAIQAVMNGEQEHFHDYLADDVIFHTPVVTKHEDHAEALHDKARIHAVALTDVEIRVDHLVAEDDLVCAHCTFMYTHSGTLEHPHHGTFEPTGARVENPALILFRVTDGKIGEVWYYAKTAEVLAAAAN